METSNAGEGGGASEATGHSFVRRRSSRISKRSASELHCSSQTTQGRLKRASPGGACAAAVEDETSAHPPGLLNEVSRPCQPEEAAGAQLGAEHKDGISCRRPAESDTPSSPQAPLPSQQHTPLARVPSLGRHTPLLQLAGTSVGQVDPTSTPAMPSEFISRGSPLLGSAPPSAAQVLRRQPLPSLQHACSSQQAQQAASPADVGRLANSDVDKPPSVQTGPASPLPALPSSGQQAGGIPFPLRPSTPVQRQYTCDTLLPQECTLGELCCRLAASEEEVLGLRRQLVAAQHALALQEGSQVALAAELEWAREGARNAQLQQGVMDVLMAKNAELQEQVRQLSTRQHMVQQQLVAAMAGRERRHAEAQQISADRDALLQQLQEAAGRQRGLQAQLSALEIRAADAERELRGVRAARDWLTPELEAALMGKAEAEGEAKRLVEELKRARAELAVWRGGGAPRSVGGIHAVPAVAPGPSCQN